MCGGGLEEFATALRSFTNLSLEANSRLSSLGFMAVIPREDVAVRGAEILSQYGLPNQEVESIMTADCGAWIFTFSGFYLSGDEDALKSLPYVNTSEISETANFK